MIIINGEACPWWYGYAWRMYDRAAFVVYPIPFNLIARLGHKIYRLVRENGYMNDNDLQQ